VDPINERLIVTAHGVAGDVPSPPARLRRNRARENENSCDNSMEHLGPFAQMSSRRFLLDPLLPLWEPIHRFVEPYSARLFVTQASSLHESSS